LHRNEYIAIIVAGHSIEIIIAIRQQIVLPLPTLR
jgi:hypothetical protein